MERAPRLDERARTRGEEHAVAADRPAPCAHPFRLAFLVALAYLVPALATLGDYGPTWDHVKGDYPYGERLLSYVETFDARFLELRALEPAPEVREPHPDFTVGRYPSHWIWPVAAMLSALSCRVLWTDLALVPAMTAHHLPAPVLTALLVFVITAFAARRLGTLAAIVAGGSLVAAPVFFGHAANNLKDGPECCFYTFAVLVGLLALERGRARYWLAAGALVGLALAQKPNALFLPIQLLAFVALSTFFAWRAGERGLRPTLAGLGCAALGFLVTYYAVSPPFWSEPIAAPRRWLTQMLVAGQFSEWRPKTVSLDGPLAVLWTTPTITLALALVGIAWKAPPRDLRLFLVLGLALPIGRNLIPGVRSFDGVRHFLEFMPMLALLAGAGAAALQQRARAWFPGRTRGTGAAIALAAIVPPMTQVIATHPNQVTYFNALAGGLEGARARGLPDTCDFWGNSYWQGLSWMSAHAEPRATLIVPFPGFIAEAAAPVRLRPDLHLWTDEDHGDESAPMYVMTLVNRNQSPFARELDKTSRPVHEIRVQGAAILRIHRLDGEAGREAYRTWLDERDNRASRKRVLAYLGTRPELSREVSRIYYHDQQGALERLLPLFPEELQGDLEATFAGLLSAEPER